MIAQSVRQELLRLCRTSLDRPPGRRAAAFAVSGWTFSWIAAHFTSTSDVPALHVLGGLLSRIGIAGDAWVRTLHEAWQGGAAGLPLLAGLLWAATSEQAQTPALLGWIAVMLGAEHVGYQPAFLLALGTLVSFVGVLWLVALGNGGFVDRDTKLVSADVVRAGVVGAALSAMVPLLVVVQVGAWLTRAYVTRPPRLLEPSSDRPQRGGWMSARPVRQHGGRAGPG